MKLFRGRHRPSSCTHFLGPQEGPTGALPLLGREAVAVQLAPPPGEMRRWEGWGCSTSTPAGTVMFISNADHWPPSRTGPLSQKRLLSSGRQSPVCGLPALCGPGSGPLDTLVLPGAVAPEPTPTGVGRTQTAEHRSVQRVDVRTASLALRTLLTLPRQKPLPPPPCSPVLLQASEWGTKPADLYLDTMSQRIHPDRFRAHSKKGHS